MRKFYFLAALLWTAFITIACLISMKNFQNIEFATEEGADKYVHASFYLLLTSLWLLYAFKKYTAPKIKIRFWVLLSTVLFGLMIELFQGLFTEDRSPDFFDVIANSSGSVLSILIFWITDKLKK